MWGLWPPELHLICGRPHISGCMPWLACITVHRVMAPSKHAVTCPPEPDPVIMGLLREGGVMRKSRFTEEQIIAILAESDAGAQTSDLCRRHGISANTFYRWRKKYGGMDVSEARSEERRVGKERRRGG